MPTSDPGTGYIALLSHILPARKRVNIHSLCKECGLRDDIEEIQEIQFSRSGARFKAFWEGRAWAGNEWHFWVPSAQSKRLKDDLERDGEIYLHLRLETSL